MCTYNCGGCACRHEHLLYAIDFLVAPVVNALIPRPAGAESRPESAPLAPLDRAASPGTSPPPDSPPLEEEPVPASPLDVRASLPPHTERAVLRNIPFLRRAVMRGGSPAAAARLCVAACAGWRETECALPAALMPALGSASSHEACLQVLMALVARQDPSQVPAPPLPTLSDVPAPLVHVGSVHRADLGDVGLEVVSVLRE